MELSSGASSGQSEISCTRLTAAPNYLESMKEVLQYHTEGDAVEVLKEEAPAEDDFPRQVLECLVQFMFSKIKAEHRAKRK